MAGSIADSYWAATSPHACHFPALSGDTEAEVVVVGGGFTGLSTAHHLLGAGVDCVVLEASGVGFGASGRNGGIAVPRYKLTYPELEAAFGADSAIEMYSMAHRALRLLHDIVQSRGLQGVLQRSGHLTPIEKASGLRRFEADVEWLRRRVGDREPRVLGRDETGYRVGSDFYAGAYHEPRGLAVHPFGYCQALGNDVARRGARIHCDSPALSWEMKDGRVIVTTPHGRVVARKLILGTGAHTDQYPIGAPLKRRIVPVASALIATAPLEPGLRRVLLPGGEVATDAKRLTNYYRLMPDGSFLFGGRGGATRSPGGRVYGRLMKDLARIFPALEGVRIDRRWFGLVDATPDSLPRLGTLAPQVAYAMGYSGRGVALSGLLGLALAQWAQGETTDLGPITDAPFNTIPFHWLQLPGKQFVMSYYRLLDTFGR